MKNSDVSWFRRLRDAPVTATFIAINVLVYVLMVVQSHHIMTFDGETLIDAGAALWSPNVTTSRWRWLTAAFVHVGLPHALMNLYVLGQIGIISERALGRGLIAAAYVVTGVTGNLLSGALAAARGVPTTSAGASGAIMGLIGMAAAFAWVTGQRAAARTLAFNILFVLGLGISLSVGRVAPIDNAAHIGGLVVGVVAGLVRARRPQPLSGAMDALLVGLSLALTAVGFLIVRLGDLGIVAPGG
jgi:rhomboid protease GluP